MKKLFVCMLAGALMFSAGACSGSEGKDSGTPASEPVYDSKELLDIGMWVGVSDKITEYDDWGNKTGKVTTLTDEEFLEKYQWIAESASRLPFPAMSICYGERKPITRNV